jgi:regulator of replication initiation timing
LNGSWHNSNDGVMLIHNFLAVIKSAPGVSQKVKAMSQILPQHTIAQPTVFRIPPPSLGLFILLAILSIWPALTLAEVRVVTAQGEHRMGDRDTREEAIRLATEAAKRNALEQVAVYLESITIVDGLDVTKDEIRTYTAGLVLVLEQKTNTTLDENTVVIRTDLVAQIDTEEVRQAIAALRENEDARRQLVELQQENDQLQQDLDAANQALAQASTSEQTQQAAQQRQNILNRVQSNAMVSQAWTDWVLVSPVGYSSSSLVGLAQLQALLNAAQGLYPTSPHVQMAQQVIITRQPSAPPRPPFPPVPGMRQPTMPRHQITPAPGSPTVTPRTLNEFTYRTPTALHHIDNQPGGIHHVPPSTESRTLTEIRQMNPFMQPPSAAPPQSEQTQMPGSRSVRSLQQFLQSPPAAAGAPPAMQSPMPRHLPPTMNQIYPPSFQQTPHIPHQIAPRGLGGGGYSGGGGGGHRGGGHGR